MSKFDEATIITLEQEYPLVNVRPIADRISRSPDVHHPDGALKAAVRKAQEKAEAESKRGREVAERQVRMEREGTEFAEVYGRFLDWFNGHLLACKENHLTSPEMDSISASRFASTSAGAARPCTPTSPASWSITVPAGGEV